MADTLIKGAHVTDKEKAKLARQYAKRYNKGESIRSIADDQGRSFGFVHGLLKQAGVELRSRGTQKGTRTGPRGARSQKVEAPVVDTVTQEDGSIVEIPAGEVDWPPEEDERGY